MTNELEIIEKKEIKGLIYEVRGKQVMLDSDLAILYECVNGTKTINQAISRNKEKFPNDFYFQLSEEEYKYLHFQFETEDIDSLRSHIGTLENKSMKGKHRKYLPYVFTEQGIAMLSSVIRTPKAVEVNIKIMRSFVEMRKFIYANKNMFERMIILENKIDTKFLEHDNKFDELFNYFNHKEEFKQKIFFEGQIYDSYSLIIDIIKKAKKEIIIIDNYIDKSILDILSKKNKDVKVIIIGKNSLKLSKMDIDKFNKQYPRIELRYNNQYHDRFIIIDKDVIYHLGASLKDLGTLWKIKGL